MAREALVFAAAAGEVEMVNELVAFAFAVVGEILVLVALFYCLFSFYSCLTNKKTSAERFSSYWALFFVFVFLFESKS